MSNQFFDREDVRENKGVGILMAVFSFLFFLPLIAGNMKNSSYLKFRANQSCIVFLGSAISGIIGKIPIIGLIGSLLGIVFLVYTIINIVYAATEETQGKPLPVIGSIEIIK
ncbi:MAG: hypothetical protein SOU50_02045 [Oscillospiraceae bacterium]|nr:hypothetical protein [Oscillospiraceae bacterium]MDY2846988.1 hypothetical protein [Oscillospiraceae bacterium]